MRQRPPKPSKYCHLYEACMLLSWVGRKIHTDCTITNPHANIIKNKFIKSKALASCIGTGTMLTPVWFPTLKSKKAKCRNSHTLFMHQSLWNTMETTRVNFVGYADFILGTPEKPSQEMLKRENTEEQETINTNSYLVVKDYKDGPTKIQGYPLSKEWDSCRTRRHLQAWESLVQDYGNRRQKIQREETIKFPQRIRRAPHC